MWREIRLKLRIHISQFGEFLTKRQIVNSISTVHIQRLNIVIGKLVVVLLLVNYMVLVLGKRVYLLLQVGGCCSLILLSELHVLVAYRVWSLHF